MKKILAVIITALTVALTTALSGCSAALSEEEYFDKLMENYKAYSSNIVLISTGFGELTTDPSADMDWSEFETEIAEAKSSLEKIEKLSPPPDIQRTAPRYLRKNAGRKGLVRRCRADNQRQGIH